MTTINGLTPATNPSYLNTTDVLVVQRGGLVDYQTTTGDGTAAGQLVRLNGVNDDDTPCVAKAQLPDDIAYAVDDNFTPVPSNLTTGGTMTYTGKYKQVGDTIFASIRVQSSTGSTANAGTTYFSGLPIPPASLSVCQAADAAANVGVGTGSVTTDGKVYVPSWTSLTDVIINFFYFIT